MLGNQGSPASMFTKLEKLPSVELIINGAEGGTLNTFSFGVNPGMAAWLNQSCQMDDPDCPVKKQTALMSLGQDIFEVTREFVLFTVGMAYRPRSVTEIRNLMRNMPETATYQFVVSY